MTLADVVCYKLLFMNKIIVDERWTYVLYCLHNVKHTIISSVWKNFTGKTG